MLLFLKFISIIAGLFYVFTGTGLLASSFDIKIKKDQIWVNDEAFFVKGIGYSPFRPKENPREKKIDMQQHRHDFKAIRKAGFNTLRTWSPLTLEELELARQYGLMVIQGMWIDYRKNFSEPDTIASIAEQLDQVVLESKEVGNVIMYLVGNEPLPSQVFSIGREKTDLFFKNLKDTIQTKNKTALVSMSNWVQCDFLNDAMWDVNSFNLYPYNPESISFAMGYRGYVNWLKRERARNRPLIITEMGLSVSPAGPGQFGYGGNSETEQKDGLIYMLNEAIAGDVDGYCVFEWIDEWWKNFNHPSDSEIHEPHDAEEWFGIVHYDEQYQFHKREAYYAIKQWNQAFMIEPRDLSTVSDKILPIRVNTEAHVDSVVISVTGQDLHTTLKRKSTHWFQGELNLKHLNPGKYTIHMKATGGLSGQHIADLFPEIEIEDIRDWSTVLELLKSDTPVKAYLQEILGESKINDFKEMKDLEFFDESLKQEIIHTFNAILKDFDFITRFLSEIQSDPELNEQLKSLMKQKLITGTADSLAPAKDADLKEIARFILRTLEHWHPDIFMQVYEQEIFIHYDPKQKLLTPYKVEIRHQQDTYHTKSKMTPIPLQFVVTDQKGQPVPNQTITVSIYEPVLNQKLMLELETDGNGSATQVYEVNEPGVLTVAAGIPLVPEGNHKMSESKNTTVPIDLISKNGDCKHIYIYY